MGATLRNLAFQATFNFSPGVYANPVNHELGAFPFSVQFIKQSTGQNICFDWRLKEGLERSAIEVTCGMEPQDGIIVSITGIKDCSNEITNIR